MPRPVPELLGPHLRLAAADPSRDAAGYLALYHDERIRTYVGDPPLRSQDEAEAELRRLTAIKTISLWLIRRQGQEDILGRYFLDRASSPAGIVVGEGVRVAPGCWRTGVHREARTLMLRYAFEDCQAAVFTTRARLDNLNMVRSAESHGFSRGPDQRHGAHDYAVFSLTSAQYRQRGR